MSGSKTVTRPPTKTEDAGTEQQPCDTPSVCCEQVREVAYFKWQEAGCPCGDGVEFWLAAEAELIARKQPENDASEK